MRNDDSRDAKDGREEVKELLERCLEMEKDLANIKERLARIQQSVNNQLNRPLKRGSSNDDLSARSLASLPRERDRRRPPSTRSAARRIPKFHRGPAPLTAASLVAQISSSQSSSRARS